MKMSVTLRLSGLRSLHWVRRCAQARFSMLSTHRKKRSAISMEVRAISKIRAISQKNVAIGIIDKLLVFCFVR